MPKIFELSGQVAKKSNIFKDVPINKFAIFFIEVNCKLKYASMSQCRSGSV